MEKRKRLTRKGADVLQKSGSEKEAERNLKKLVQEIYGVEALVWASWEEEMIHRKALILPEGQDRNNLIYISALGTSWFTPDPSDPDIPEQLRKFLKEIPLNIRMRLVMGEFHNEEIWFDLFQEGYSGAVTGPDSNPLWCVIMTGVDLKTASHALAHRWPSAHIVCDYGVENLELISVRIKHPEWDLPPRVDDASS